DAFDIANFNIRTLIRTVRAGRPGTDPRIGPAVGAVAHADIGLGAVDVAHVDPKFETRARVDLVIKVAVAENRAGIVAVLWEKQTARPGERRGAGIGHAVRAQHLSVGWECSVADPRRLADTVLEIVVPAVGDTNFDGRRLPRGRSSELHGTERDGLVDRRR